MNKPEPLDHLFEQMTLLALDILDHKDFTEEQRMKVDEIYELASALEHGE